MAIWQFDVLIAPREPIRLLTAAGSDELPGDAVESTSFWIGHQLPAAYEHQLEAILPWSPSWDPEWTLFGSEDGTRVDIISDEGRLDEVKLRVDARTIEPELIERLMDFFHAVDCVLITPSGRVVDPDPMAFWVELQMSSAMAFVRDPSGHLGRFQRRRDRE